MTKGNKPSILIVEDETIISAGLKMMLEDCDYEVMTALTGEEAVELAEKETPDLIIMDILLAEELDGLKAASIIQEKSKTALIYLTAISTKLPEEVMRKTAPAAVFRKPPDMDQMMETIHKILRPEGIAEFQ